MPEWPVILRNSTHNKLLYRSTPMHAIVVDIECFTWNILGWSTYFTAQRLWPAANPAS